MKSTFKKAERLHKKILIQELFKKGSSFYFPPLRIIFLQSSDIELNQVLISVPKKNFKKAVDRNKIKRRIKEAYRLNKHQLATEKKYIMAFIYSSSKSLTFQKIDKAILSALSKINTTA